MEGRRSCALLMGGIPHPKAHLHPVEVRVPFHTCARAPQKPPAQQLRELFSCGGTSLGSRTPPLPEERWSPQEARAAHRLCAQEA